MKTHIYYYYLAGQILLATGCVYHDIPPIVANSDLKGTWAITQVYANDHWGGPLSWKNANSNKEIKFTPDLEYFIKTTNDFVLIGTYKVISEQQIEITWDKPTASQYPTYLLHYEFDPSSRLTLTTGTSEGVVLEKYELKER
jgi:hypothetical protein